MLREEERTHARRSHRTGDPKAQDWRQRAGLESVFKRGRSQPHKREPLSYVRDLGLVTIGAVFATALWCFLSWLSPPVLHRREAFGCRQRAGLGVPGVPILPASPAASTLLGAGGSAGQPLGEARQLSSGRVWEPRHQPCQIPHSHPLLQAPHAAASNCKQRLPPVAPFFGFMNRRPY